MTILTDFCHFHKNNAIIKYYNFVLELVTFFTIYEVLCLFIKFMIEVIYMVTNKKIASESSF